MTHYRVKMFRSLNRPARLFSRVWFVPWSPATTLEAQMKYSSTLSSVHPEQWFNRSQSKIRFQPCRGVSTLWYNPFPTLMQTGHNVASYHIPLCHILWWRDVCSQMQHLSFIMYWPTNLWFPIQLVRVFIPTPGLRAWAAQRTVEATVSLANVQITIRERS